MTAGRLAALRALLIDLDGVVYTGSTPIPGAAAFFTFLRETGRVFQCITNNSTLSPDQYVRKLASMGIAVDRDHLLTSSQATAMYLRTQFPEGARMLAIGEGGLVQALLSEGFRLVTLNPDAVVCGLDRRLTYQRLAAAALGLRAGARFVATNPDLSLPDERGLLPANGSTLAYLQAATGVAPLVIGKPEATMLNLARERLGATREETAIIGDGLATDILAGQRSGVATILMLTGVSQRVDLPHAAAQPDYIFEDLPRLQAALAQGGPQPT